MICERDAGRRRFVLGALPACAGACMLLTRSQGWAKVQRG